MCVTYLGVTVLQRVKQIENLKQKFLFHSFITDFSDANIEKTNSVTIQSFLIANQECSFIQTVRNSFIIIFSAPKKRAHDCSNFYL